MSQGQALGQVALIAKGNPRPCASFMCLPMEPLNNAANSRCSTVAHRTNQGPNVCVSHFRDQSDGTPFVLSSTFPPVPPLKRGHSSGPVPGRKSPGISVPPRQGQSGPCAWGGGPSPRPPDASSLPPSLIRAPSFWIFLQRTNMPGLNPRLKPARTSADVHPRLSPSSVSECGLCPC